MARRANAPKISGMSATHLTVREFMTPDPVTIDGGLSVADARTRMFQINARHLPVYVGGHLVGILSDRDLARISSVDGFESATSTAEQACTASPYVVGPTTSLAEVAQVLADQKFGAALVMEGGHLLGMFTVIDALRALVSVLTPAGTSLDLDESPAGADLNESGARTPDARRDALIHNQNRRDNTTNPGQGVRVGIDSGTQGGEIRSDVGRRAELRRAATTVLGRNPDDDKSGS